MIGTQQIFILTYYSNFEDYIEDTHHGYCNQCCDRERGYIVGVFTNVDAVITYINNQRTRMFDEYIKKTEKDKDPLPFKFESISDYYVCIFNNINGTGRYFIDDEYMFQKHDEENTGYWTVPLTEFIENYNAVLWMPNTNDLARVKTKVTEAQKENVMLLEQYKKLKAALRDRGVLFKK